MKINAPSLLVVWIFFCILPILSWAGDPDDVDQKKEEPENDCLEKALFV